MVKLFGRRLKHRSRSGQLKKGGLETISYEDMASHLHILMTYSGVSQ